jgi:solute carrier family 39 (zinc transporter), member 7
MGISIHNYSAGGAEEGTIIDLAAALRMDASGILGTTVQYGDLVSAALAQLLCE